MPNFIPPASDHELSPSKQDGMSKELRSKFLKLQCLRSAKENNVLQASPKNSDTSKGSFEDTDDETMHSDQADSSQASSATAMDLNLKDDSEFLQLAISTAISAQSEIDALMNGIAELEDLVNANHSNTALARTGHPSSVSGRNKSTCTNSTLIHDFDM